MTLPSKGRRPINVVDSAIAFHRRRIAGRAWDFSGKSSTTRVFAVATKQLIATSDAALDALPGHWDAQGLHLLCWSTSNAAISRSPSPSLSSSAIVDTGPIVALLNSADAHHER